jgi:hypothetical protein
MGAVAVLTCNNANPTAANRPPAFGNAAIDAPPTQCGGGATAALAGEINLLDPDLKYPQNMRATLGFDRRLFSNWTGTAEVLYTRGVNGLFYENIALAPAQGTNAVEGRVIYGTAPGAPVLKAIPGGACPGTAGCRTQIFDVTNQSKDYAYSLTGGIQRRYIRNYEGSLYYTYTRAYDVQSFTSSTAFSQLRFGRAWGGNVSDKSVGRSTFEQRHRIVGTGTYTLPSKTDVSVIYFGESGAPYTYIASSDLNGDGLTLNDPVYVPNDATDPTEMFFNTASFNGVSYTGLQQAVALERFIENQPCLRENRGKILPRNACDNPFTHTVNVSLRQSFNTVRLQNVTLQLDMFNFLNLVNKTWGWQPSAGTSPITLLGSTNNYVNGTILTGQPAYTFNPFFVKDFTNNLRSNYQIQLQARYAF